MILIEIFVLWYIPMEISFARTEIFLSKKFLYLITFFFFLDICLSCNTGIEDKGVLIVGKKQIIKMYFKKNFVYDLIALISLILMLFKADRTKPTPFDLIYFFAIFKVYHVL